MDISANFLIQIDDFELYLEAVRAHSDLLRGHEFAAARQDQKLTEYSSKFTLLVGTRASFSVNEIGWKAEWGAISGEMLWNEPSFSGLNWKGNLLLIAAQVYCFVPRRALTVPSHEIVDFACDRAIECG